MGLGLSAEVYAQIVEHVSKVWMSISGIFNSHLIMCTDRKVWLRSNEGKVLTSMARGELRVVLHLRNPIAEPIFKQYGCVPRKKMIIIF